MSWKSPQAGRKEYEEEVDSIEGNDNFIDEDNNPFLSAARKLYDALFFYGLDDIDFDAPRKKTNAKISPRTVGPRAESAREESDEVTFQSGKITPIMEATEKVSLQALENELNDAMEEMTAVEVAIRSTTSTGEKRNLLVKRKYMLEDLIEQLQIDIVSLEAGLK